MEDTRKDAILKKDEELEALPIISMGKDMFYKEAMWSILDKFGFKTPAMVVSKDITRMKFDFITCLSRSFESKFEATMGDGESVPFRQEECSWFGDRRRASCGLNLWSEPLIVTPNVRRVAALLMDSEALPKDQNNVQQDAISDIIDFLSNRVSSTTFFSVCSKLEENHLSILHVYNENVEGMRKDMEKNLDDPSNNLVFFVFRIRDFGFVSNRNLNFNHTKVKETRGQDGGIGAVQRVCDELRTQSGIIDRSYVGGSVGKRTAAVKNPDFDVVVFVNNFEPPFSLVLDYFKQILKSSNVLPGLRVVGKTEFSLKLNFLGYNIDLLPAANYSSESGRQAKSPVRDARQALEVLKKIQSNHSENYYAYSSSLEETQLRFPREQCDRMDDPSALRRLVRLYKAWNTKIPEMGYISGQSTLIELIDIHVAQQEGSQSLVRGFAARMKRWNHKFCSNYKQLDLLWLKFMESSRILNQQFSNLLHQQAQTLKMSSLNSPPLNYMTTFDRWEQSIEDNFVRRQLSDWLCTKFHPSTDFKVNIRTLLGALMSRKVARQFHWSGRHGKRSFEGTEIQYLLFDVIRAKFQSATDYDIEGPVKKWLKRADFLYRQKTNVKSRPTTLTHIRRQKSAKVKQLLVRELGKKSVKNSVRGQKPKTKVVIY